MGAIGTRAVAAVRRAGVAHVLHKYHLPERTGRERDARPAYGLDTAAIGGRRAELADPSAAEKLTGYQVGGISPLGSRRPLPVVLDESAYLFDTVLCSAGRRGLQVELAPADLVRLAGARVAQIARAC